MSNSAGKTELSGSNRMAIDIMAKVRDVICLILVPFLFIHGACMCT